MFNVSIREYFSILNVFIVCIRSTARSKSNPLLCTHEDLYMFSTLHPPGTGHVKLIWRVLFLIIGGGGLHRTAWDTGICKCNTSISTHWCIHHWPTYMSHPRSKSCKVHALHTLKYIFWQPNQSMLCKNICRHYLLIERSELNIVMHMMMMDDDDDGAGGCSCLPSCSMFVKQKGLELGWHQCCLMHQFPEVS